ncbi:TPA: periplasmic heavy metal sensor [Enterobacter cloacae]|nr:periplasmic heavy metal sensor [Enterobacter cloacae]
MNWINKPMLALIALILPSFGSTSAIARPNWEKGGCIWQQNASLLTADQQTAVQKIRNDFYTQISTLRQQLMSRRYEYNALLTISPPDNTKISVVAKEMEALNKSMDELRVKRDIAMAEAGVPRGAGMNYGACGDGGYHRGGGNW